MIIFTPLLIGIAILIPLFVIFWSIKLGVTTLRWLLLLNKNHISPMGRGLAVVQIYPLRDFKNQLTEHHGHTSGLGGPTSLDPPAEWGHHDYW